MSAGALSDPQVVEASQKVVPILVDCTQRGDYDDLKGQYGVRGYPTILFVDSNGTAIDEMDSRDAASLAAKIQRAAGGGSAPVSGQEAEEIAGAGFGIACCLFTILGALAGLAIEVILMVFTYKDAKNRGDQNLVLWMLLVFFLGLIGFIIYIVARPQGSVVLCPNCRNKKLDTLVNCPHCGAPSK